ncbi:MAG: prolyl oligopeptidase family serine peptidase [Rhodobacterales bacterium]|nr:prolyl oligopeptidase family serine peptidase [Rhodobacterales bacterium]
MGLRGFGPPLRVGRVALGGMWCDDLRFGRPGGESVAAWFLHPRESGQRVGAVLYCHAHGNRYDIGRAEFLSSRPALQSAWAPALAALGLAALCLEMPCFGDRAHPGEAALSKALLWRGETLFGQMLAEQIAGIDFLASQPDIDPDRIGALGLSMGGTLAWWLAALDTRLRATVQMCAFADMAGLIARGANDVHGAYMTVPGLLRLTTTGALAGLAAPRAQMVCLGLADPGTPADCVATARRDMDAAYAAAAAPPPVWVIDPDSGHVETPAMRTAATAFLRHHLT